MTDNYAERFPVSTTTGIAQPWQDTHESQDDYMVHALAAEKAGSRLVVETWVNGYADPMGEGDTWFVDWLDYTDWRTGEHIWGFDPDETEPVGERDGFLIVERRVAETA